MLTWCKIIVVMALLWLKRIFGVDKTLKKYTSTFRSTDGQERKFSYWFNINQFKSFPSFFNIDLARLSLAKAMASYNGIGEYETRDRHIKAFHENLGFEHIESNDAYLQPPLFDSIGVQLGYRVFRQRFHKTVLISIAIRSGGYESEWGSNFVFGEEGHHKGFLIAAKQVMEEFREYFEKHELNKYWHVKIWVSGYSRGGAVSNLVAAKFLSYFKRSRDKVFQCAMPSFRKNTLGEVYAYTFESPCPAHIARRSHPFNSIFNVFSPADVVPFTPFPYMGFDRYGTSLTRSIHFEDVDDIQDYLPNLKLKEFKVKELAKISLIDSELQYSDQAFIQELLRFFEKEAKISRYDYVTKYEPGISRAAAFVKSMDGADVKKLASNIKASSILGAIVMQRNFNKLIKGLVEETGRPYNEERLEEICVYLRTLILDLIKVDRAYHFRHIATLLASSGALFQNHDIELIYSYLSKHDLTRREVIAHES